MKTYKLQADTVNGVQLVSDFDVEPTTPEIFYALLSDPDYDEVMCAEVNRVMYDKISSEYGIEAERAWAAITDNLGKVRYEAHVPIDATSIEVAGAVDKNGYPVNRRPYKVSRSKRNLARANGGPLRESAPGLVERKYAGVVFYVEA